MCSISVIVPIYNVEDYLEDCLLSIMNQTFKDYEVIMIDDGSTDRSSQIAQRYGHEDRFTYVRQVNKGLGEARNTGIKKAKGKYILLVDSDDVLVFNCLKKLYALIEEFGTDIVGYSLIEAIDPVSYVFFDNSSVQTYYLSNREEIIEAYIDKKISTMAQLKFYNARVFQNASFSDIRLHEDVYFMPDLISNINTALITDGKFYIWRMRPNSLTSKPFSKDRYYSIVSGQRFLDYIKEEEPKYLADAEYMLAERKMEYLEGILKGHVYRLFRRDYLLIERQLKEYLKTVPKDSVIRKKEKFKKVEMASRGLLRFEAYRLYLLHIRLVNKIKRVLKLAT